MQAIGRQRQRAPDGAPVQYECHRPEQTTLYRLVQQHAASFITHTEASTGMNRCGPDGLPVFVESPAPTDEALQAVLHKFITRTMKLLTRRGVLVEEEGSTHMADNDGDSDEARALRSLQAAACTYRSAFGPRAGQKVLTVQGVMPREIGMHLSLQARAPPRAPARGQALQAA